MTAELAVVGGSGLFDFEGLEVVAEHPVETLYGEPTAPVLEGILDGVPLFFLSRHGKGRHVPPHLINYRANIKALHDLGAQRIVTVNIVGGISPDMWPGAWVIPDQIIDYTWGREHTYSDGENEDTQHVDFSEPYDGDLSRALLAAATEKGVPVVAGGTYACTQGPRLESSAEISRLQRDNCDIVGMTAMPEACLARELAMPYAALCLVVNWGAGISSEMATLADMQAIVDHHMPQARQVIAALGG